jgi:uncharacterized protein YeaO (DUF488 family)
MDNSFGQAGIIPKVNAGVAWRSWLTSPNATKRGSACCRARSNPLAIRIVRLGTARTSEEGVRLGTVRRPPRGVKKADYASRDFFDAWFPELAPSAKLVKRFYDQPEITDKEWTRYAKAYRREMSEPDRRRILDVLARLSHQANFAVGCYCENFERCHRSILQELLLEHGAEIAPAD